MNRMRLVICAALATLLIAVGMVPAVAQDATPVPQEASLGPVADPSGTLPGNPQVQLIKIAEGLADPVNIAAPNDDSNRVFVVERTGTIRIIDEGGSLLDDPFLDISVLVKTDFLEQGLLGLAFHPDFQNNGFFYVFYNDYQTNGAVVVSEYGVTGDDPNVADPDSARVLLTQEKPYVNHNGGTLRFGPDGYLYISIGDGGLAGDPFDNAQRVDNWLGKILRIDVDSRDAGAYGIPVDNPFAGTGVVLPSNEASQMAQDGSYRPNAKREICNWGLRNPWQFNFDPSNGDLYITDVGQNAWEEVNVLPSDQPCGSNFGWDPNEGAYCYPPGSSCFQAGTLPVANYNHAEGDCSITGMGVYRGQESPDLDGIYFNSDFCSGTIYGLVQGDDGSWNYQRLLETALDVTGAGQDANGELFLTVCSCEYSRDYNPLENPGGTVWRLVSADAVPEGAETAPAPAPEATPEQEQETALEATPESD